jgi:hypothetical protein
MIFKDLQSFISDRKKYIADSKIRSSKENRDGNSFIFREISVWTVSLKTVLSPREKEDYQPK